jgi:hypothetical protein
MADTYGILLSSFFDGTTGMRLQAMGATGKDAMLLGAFLTANEFANMIGLYELSMSKLARKLPALKGRTIVLRSFATLSNEQFAQYDEETEFVWVREMARVRLGIVAGEKVANPRRLVAAQNLYQRAPMNPFLGPFYDRYQVELALKHRRGQQRSGPPQTGGMQVSEPSVTHSPTGSPNTSPNGSPNTSPNVQQTFAERASGTSTYRDQRSEIRDQGSVKAAAAPRTALPIENPVGNVDVITSLVQKDILPLGLQESELVDATKDRCAQLHIAYDSTTVRKAVESAQVRARLRMATARLRQA